MGKFCGLLMSGGGETYPHSPEFVCVYYYHESGRGEVFAEGYNVNNVTKAAKKILGSYCDLLNSSIVSPDNITHDDLEFLILIQHCTEQNDGVPPTCIRVI